MEDRHNPDAANATEARVSWPSGGVPMDLIVHIILSALSDLQKNPSGNGSTALKCLYNLRSVNSTWSLVVNNTPELWTFIDSSVPLTIVDVALGRSKDRLLSILCRPNAFIKASAFMERVIPHIQRWGAVNLSDMALQHIPQTPAPRLHELVLTSRHDIWGPDIPQQIFGGDCSSLRRLVLEYVAFAGTHEHFPVFGKNLRSLIIRQLGQRHSEITYTHVYQFLLQHPNLVELEIQTFKWSNATANPELLAELHLPSLRRFKLFGLVSHGQAHALPIQKIKAPNCTSFELRIPMGTQEPSGVLWAIAPYFVSVITAVPKDLKFSLAFDPDFTIAIGRGEKKFKVTLSGNCRDAGLDWVMNMLAQHRPNVTCFSISGLWTRLDEELSNLFAVLTDVTQFHVGGSMLAVWNTLGRPREPAADGGPVQWLLPDLEQLVVRNPSGEGELHQCFIAAMQAREAAAVERHATGRQSRDHPKVLTKVEYQSGSQPKQDKQLSDILGDRLFD